MNLKRLIVLFLLFIITGTKQSGAQGLDASILKPINTLSSPTVANLNTFQTIPVGLYTGTPYISIPIYNIQTPELNIPIQLMYHTSNVKPDIHPGNVGLGWSLFAGGSITRQINGLPDEKRLPAPIPTKGDDEPTFISQPILNSEITRSSETPPYTTPEMSMARDIWEELSGQTGSWLPMAWDRESDKYSFNFSGYSGSFYIDKNGWHVISDTKFKIDYEILSIKKAREPIAQASTSYTYVYGSILSYISRFRLTAPDGTIFIFGGHESVDFAVEYAPLNSPSTSKLNAPVAITWHLSEVITPNGHTISFNHKVSNTIFTGDLSVYAQVPLEDYEYYKYFKVTKSKNILMPVDLASINVDGQEIASFEYQESVQKPYDSEYLSISDKEPYIDAKIGVKWNQLSRIRINNQFDVDFTYTSSNERRLQLLKIEKKEKADPTKIETYKFGYALENFLPYFSGKYDHLGFFNTPVSINFSIYDQQWQNELQGKTTHAAAAKKYMDSRMSNDIWYDYGVLTQIQYPTGGSTTFTYERHQIKGMVNIQKTGISPAGEFEYPGGFRIKQITNWDINNKRTSIKKYYYLSDFNPVTKSGKSSGILSFTPKYTWNFSSYFLPRGLEKYFYFKRAYIFSSQSTPNTVSNIEGYHVGYSEVIECEEDENGNLINGYTKHTFNNFDNDIYGTTHMDGRPVVLVNGGNILADRLKPNGTTSADFTQPPFMPVSSRSNERGRLTSISIYDNNNILKKTILNKYKRTSEYAIENSSMSISPRATYLYDEEVETGRFGFGGQYNVYISNYLPIEKTTTAYENGQTLSYKEEFSYNSIDQLVSHKTIYDPASNESAETKIRYLQDLIDSHSGNLQSTGIYGMMKDKYMIGYPIESINYKNGKVIDGSAISYKSVNTNMIVRDVERKLHTAVPLDNYTYASLLNEGGSVQFDNRYSALRRYNEYDQYSNPTEIENPLTGEKTVYLWSYKGIYPIAEIKNSTYTTIKNVLGSSFVSNLTGSGSLSDNDFSTLNNLRNSQVNSHISIYKYIPFVGLSQSVDPSGSSIFYEYDGFGRFVRKLNNDQKVIESYRYNYKH